MPSRYEQLSARVDAFHRRVRRAHPGALTCHAGCSMCCHQHLTVIGFEFKRIVAAVAALSAPQLSALAQRLGAGREDPRCPLLDAAGRCLTYEVRPMICRSHGVPIEVGEPSVRDVCPLNFVDGPDIEGLDDSLVLDVDRLNVMLGLIDRFDGAGDGSRVDLLDGLAALLGLPGAEPETVIRTASE